MHAKCPQCGTVARVVSCAGCGDDVGTLLCPKCGSIPAVNIAGLERVAGETAPEPNPAVNVEAFDIGVWKAEFSSAVMGKKNDKVDALLGQMQGRGLRANWSREAEAQMWEFGEDAVTELLRLFFSEVDRETKR